MTLIIIIFGALIVMAGIVLILRPETIFGLLNKNAGNPVLHLLAVVVRLVLGALLIHQSGFSSYPFVIEIIGWISVVAAVTLALIGRNNFKRLMAWALTLAHTLARAGGVAAVGLGAFLIYAFVW